MGNTFEKFNEIHNLQKIVLYSRETVECSCFWQNLMYWQTPDRSQTTGDPTPFEAWPYNKELEIEQTKDSPSNYYHLPDWAHLGQN